MKNGQAYQQKTEKFSVSEEKKFGKIDSRRRGRTILDPPFPNHWRVRRSEKANKLRHKNPRRLNQSVGFAPHPHHNHFPFSLYLSYLTLFPSLSLFPFFFSFSLSHTHTHSFSLSLSHTSCVSPPLALIEWRDECVYLDLFRSKANSGDISGRKANERERAKTNLIPILSRLSG